MQIRNNVALTDYSTMRLGGLAAHVVEITNRDELLEALAWAEQRQLPVIMIGAGSNSYWRDEGFAGLVIVNKLLGYQDVAEDETNHLITVGAGEVWDTVVARSVLAGLTGLEYLSLIPGLTGATPVQNVGAYGQEIARVLVQVEAYDRHRKQFVTMPAADCALVYRGSRFKIGPDKGRFFITGIRLRLKHANPERPFYGSLQAYLDEHGIREYTPQTIRDAVVAIRRAKLPDPAIVPNNGSFFANPLIDQATFAKLHDAFPDIPNWPQKDGRIKLPAAWLVAQAGFKNYHDPTTGMATWPAQALVFINEHARTTADLETFRQKVVRAVQQKFGITLHQEPELLP